MELRKIEESDLAGKGVRGQADVPGLSAEEMQEKIEEIARFAIEKINEIIEYLAQNGASKEDLQNLLIKAGSVSSVFGRAGDVKPKKGDYNAEMVGAAKESTANSTGRMERTPSPRRISARRRLNIPTVISLPKEKSEAQTECCS